MPKPMITAHSGCEGTPGDSLEAVARGVSLGADGVEVDVRLDAEGELRLSHDRRADYAGAARLADALAMVKEAGVCVNCDIKERAALYPVLTLVERLGLERGQLILSGALSLELLADDPGIAWRCRLFLNVEEVAKLLLVPATGDFRALMRDPWRELKPLGARLLDEQAGRIAAMARSVGAEVLNLPFGILTEERADALREAGLALSLWTVNAPDDLCRWMSAGAEHITTLAPALALRLREEAMGE